MDRMAILLMVLFALSGSNVDKAVAQVTNPSAEQHMQVARHYVSRHDYTGAINRYRIVVTKFQSSDYVEEAFAHLTEAYLALGIASEAKAAAAAMECRFPNGDWTVKAKALLESAGLKPAENPASWISCR